MQKLEAGEIKGRADIVREIGARIPLAKKNGHFEGHCPWHEDKHPSLWVYPHNQSFYCYSCGAKWDVIDFIAQFYEVDFRAALKILAGDILPDTPKRIISMPEKSYVDAEEEFAKYKIPSTPQIQSHAKALGVLPGSLRWMDARISDGVLVFPMRDEDRKIIGLRFRARNGRKWSLTSARSGLFIPNLKFKFPNLFITEGPTDCAALLTTGLFGIGRASCLGQEKMIAAYLEKNGVTEVVIVADDDTPGLDGAIKLREILSATCHAVIRKPPHKDIRESLKKLGVEQLTTFLNQP
jgi:DNA primase